MAESEYGSERFSKIVEALKRLPGVGTKTAQRYALHLQRSTDEVKQSFLESLRGFILDVQFCPSCHSFSDDGDLCQICNDPRRDESLLCVIADVRDQMVLERASLYHGHYFVLGSLIDPMAGVGPDQLPIQALINRIKDSPIREVILAFCVSMEGDTTTYYLQKKLEPLGVTISIPARGMAFGESIDQTDDFTLTKALENRTHIYQPFPERQGETDHQLSSSSIEV